MQAQLITPRQKVYGVVAQITVVWPVVMIQAMSFAMMGPIHHRAGVKIPGYHYTPAVIEIDHLTKILTVTLIHIIPMETVVIRILHVRSLQQMNLIKNRPGSCLQLKPVMKDIILSRSQTPMKLHSLKLKQI